MKIDDDPDFDKGELLGRYAAQDPERTITLDAYEGRVVRFSQDVELRPRNRAGIEKSLKPGADLVFRLSITESASRREVFTLLRHIVEHSEDILPAGDITVEQSFAISRERDHARKRRKTERLDEWGIPYIGEE